MFQRSVPDAVDEFDGTNDGFVRQLGWCDEFDGVYYGRPYDVIFFARVRLRQRHQQLYDTDDERWFDRTVLNYQNSNAASTADGDGFGNCLHDERLGAGNTWCSEGCDVQRHCGLLDDVWVVFFLHTVYDLRVSIFQTSNITIFVEIRNHTITIDAVALGFVAPSRVLFIFIRVRACLLICIVV